MSKEHIHPDIISKENQEEQLGSHGQQWRITEKRSDDTVQLTDLLMDEPGNKCECVLLEGGPGMGKSTLAWQVCHHWRKREFF